jgi:hypothetical protein
VTTITTQRFVLDDDDVPVAQTYDPTDPDQTAAAIGYDATAGAAFVALPPADVATAVTNGATDDAADATEIATDTTTEGLVPSGES